MNTTRFGNLRVDLDLKISNENDLLKVKTVIQEVLSKNNKIVNSTATDIIVGKFFDGQIQLNVKPYCLPANTGALTSELYEEIKIAFEKNNIKLAVVK